MTTPIYRRIKALILKEIEDMPANSPIASEREMTACFEASRMTIRNAINELVEEGYLYRNKNKGTFVADQKLMKKNTAAISEDDVAEFSVLFFNLKKAHEMGPTIAKKLEIDEFDLVLHIVRQNTLNNKPVSIEEIFIARANISDDQMNNFKALLDLSRYLQEGRITQQFHPMLVPAQFANLLKIKMNTPIIMVESIICSKSGKSLVYMKAYNNPYEKCIEITI